MSKNIYNLWESLKIMASDSWIDSMRLISDDVGIDFALSGFQDWPRKLFPSRRLGVRDVPDVTAYPKDPGVQPSCA